MPVCYFNQDYETSYNCEYEITEDIITVIVDYNVSDEVSSENGVIFFGNQTFKERDITIVDRNGRSNFLLKNAFYVEHIITFGSPDRTPKTIFKSQIFFKHQDYDKLTKLCKTPKIKKIKVFSSDIVTLYGSPSLTSMFSKKECIVKLSRENSTTTLNINSNNIKNITIGDCWKSWKPKNKNQIIIDFTGYIELEFSKRVNFDKIGDYISELIIFMQLYHPNKFIISNIDIFIDNNYYELFFPYRRIEFKEKHTKHSVNANLIDFLSNCYDEISLKKSKNYVRNIPDIIIKTSRSIEDNFLMFFRFIECYYKSQNLPNIRNKFILYSLENNYKKKISVEEPEKLAQQIISLRNHYVHSGYHLNNSCLKIRFGKIGKKNNPKNYTQNNIDYNWIYERTKILYDIVIDIIFANILKYEKYTFTENF